MRLRNAVVEKRYLKGDYQGAYEKGAGPWGGQSVKVGAGGDTGGETLQRWVDTPRVGGHSQLLAAGDVGAKGAVGCVLP